MSERVMRGGGRQLSGPASVVRPNRTPLPLHRCVCEVKIRTSAVATAAAAAAAAAVGIDQAFDATHPAVDRTKEREREMLYYLPHLHTLLPKW